MKLHLRTFAVVAATAFLAACGGGDGVAIPTVISSAQAVNTLSIAKVSNASFALDVVELSDFAIKMLPLTSPNTLTGTVRVSNNLCAGGGTFDYVYNKAAFASGLSAGDYYSVSYSACKETSTSASQSGSVVVVVLKDAPGNQNASTAWSLPVSVTFNQYKNGATEYNGSISYSSNSVAAGTEHVVAAIQSLTVFTGTASQTYTNAALNYTLDVSGLVTLGSSYDVYFSPSDVQMSVLASLFGTSITSASQATYNVTNIYGGKIIGSLPNGLINVDFGNDSTIDLAFTQAF